jgi:hypothetical protein
MIPRHRPGPRRAEHEGLACTRVHPSRRAVRRRRRQRAGAAERRRVREVGPGAGHLEFSREGELLFDAKLLPGNRTYRAFRFAWNPHPPDRPAVAAERISEDEVRIQASWNGATDVESWAVLAGKHQDRPEILGAVPRDGFETTMVARTPDQYVAVQARNRSGRALGTSEPAETRGRSSAQQG